MRTKWKKKIIIIHNERMNNMTKDRWNGKRRVSHSRCRAYMAKPKKKTFGAFRTLNKIYGRTFCMHTKWTIQLHRRSKCINIREMESMRKREREREKDSKRTSEREMRILSCTHWHRHRGKILCEFAQSFNLNSLFPIIIINIFFRYHCPSINLYLN